MASWGGIMADKQCPVCMRKHVGPIRIWRRNTQFPQFCLNYLESCIHCIRDDDLEYHWMWKEYYEGQGHWVTPYTYNQRWATEYVKPIPVRHVHKERRIT